MGGPRVQRTTALLAAGLLTLVVVGVGVGVWLHIRPTAHVVTSAQECLNAPDHVASLFSDDQNTLIRYSSLDYGDTRVLRVEPASTLPGMFDSLLALSGDSSRLAYVTADDELMDNAHLWYIDVKQPDTRHDVADVQQGLAPVRPAWSPDRQQLAYVVGTGSGPQGAGFQIWVAASDGSRPPGKISDLPVDSFARGHAAALCWTANDKVGILPGVDSATGQRGLVAPLTTASPAETSPSPSASPSPATGGSPCGVPVFSQNDPTWRSVIMQVGGDAIGGFGCALTSTAMLLNYFGATLSPTDLNACLGAAADPLVWSSAPTCTAGRVGGGEQSDFSWEGLDGFLGAGKPAIVGMVHGITGMHFVVVTRGGGGQATSYTITDPWDGSTTKSLAAYTNVGYNPRWIVTFDGSGRNCARLVPGGGQPVLGFSDGGTYGGGVTLRQPPSSGGQTTVQQVPTQGGSGLSPSPSPSPVPSPSAVPSPSPSASPTSSPKLGPVHIWHLAPGHVLHLADEGRYLVYYRHPGNAWPPRFSILTFTIDRTPPALSLLPLNLHGAVHAALGHAFTAFAPDDQPPAGPLLDRPGRLRLGALDTLSGVDHVDYRLDGGDWRAYSDVVSFTRTLSVPDPGHHSISIRAVDLAGNASELDDQPFTVFDDRPTPTPTPTPTPVQATAPPRTVPPPPPPTQPPPPPPCPALDPASALLKAAATGVAPGPITVTWSVTGGCSPFSGSLVATTVDLDNAPVPGTTRTINISIAAGSLVDHPPTVPNCIGCNHEVYSMTMTDGRGHRVTFPTTQPVLF